MVTLGRLEEIEDLRTVWQNEAQDFTKWLIDDENLKLLSSAVGIELIVDEIDENINILASEPSTNRKIIIGTQLEETSSEYFGNLITRAAAKNANIIIWIVKHAREEHKTLVQWLNSHTETDTKSFLCEVKLYTIGGSAPAAKINSLVEVNNRAKEIPVKIIDTTKPEINLERLRFEYWAEFQNYAFSEDAKNKKFAGSYKRWKNSSHYGVVFGIGQPGCNIQVTRMQNDIETGLYIADDKNLFNYLLERRDNIEEECRLIFDWLELPDGKSCKISAKRTPADIDNKDDWQKQFDWIIDTVLKEKEVFMKFIKEAEND